MVDQLLHVVSGIVRKAAQNGAGSASTILTYEPQMPKCMICAEENQDEDSDKIS